MDTPHTSDKPSFFDQPVDTIKHELNLLALSAEKVDNTEKIDGALDVAIGIGLTALTHNRYASVMVERALAAGFSTAAVHQGLKYESSAKKDSFFSTANLKAFATEGTALSAATLAGEVGGLKFSKIDNLLAEDARERVLRQGIFEGRSAKFGNNVHQLQFGVLKADTVELQTVARPLSGGGADRFRKERAMYKLQGLIGLDTESVAAAINREGATPVWLQERAPIDARHHYAKSISSSEDYAGDRMMNYLSANEAWKDQLGKTFLERLMAGEKDNHLANFAIKETPTGERTANIDTAYAFASNKVPVWGKDAYSDHVDRLFGGTKIAPEDLQKVQQFVDRFDNFKGRAELSTLKLGKREVSSYLSRAKWFLKNEVFPPAEH